MVSNPLKWHGGKTYLAKRIIALMPPHVHYVEPYFGGGAVLFAKDGEGVSEVANDVNSDLMQFWYVLSEPTLFEDFVRRANTTPFSQRLWSSAGGRAETKYPFRPPAVETALAFFVRYRQSRQGLGKDFAALSRNRTRRGMNEQVSSWLSAVEGLPEAHARLKRVVILSGDAIDVIRQQDGPNTHFYLDPPYLHETRATTSDYQHEMSEEQHKALLDVLEGITGTFQLSGYWSELYYTYALGNSWRMEEFDLPNNASGKKTKDRKTECLWMNYDPAESR